MRVIAGIYRGRRLRAVEGLEVRPTSDRLRERLFNILNPYIKESRFLDICAGSGAIGIEAISRGASEVTFIDSSRRARLAIEANLNTLAITRKTTIINRDAGASLKQLEAEAAIFDIAFFDPPYQSTIYPLVMNRLGDGHVLSEDAIVVVEHHAKHPPAPEFGGLRMYREVKQGQSALAFYSFDASRWPAPG